MKQIPKRHHPEFWDGSVKTKQSFQDGKLLISNIQDIVGGIITQNRDIISYEGTTGLVCIR